MIVVEYLIYPNSTGVYGGKQSVNEVLKTYAIESKDTKFYFSGSKRISISNCDKVRDLESNFNYIDTKMLSKDKITKMFKDFFDAENMKLDSDILIYEEKLRLKKNRLDIINNLKTKINTVEVFNSNIK